MKHAHSEEKSSLCAFSLSVRNGMVLLLLHRNPDLGVILLVQDALGEFAGVGVHFDAVAGGEMRLPELGDRLLRPLIGEGPGAAQDVKGFLLRFAVGWILSHGRIFFLGQHRTIWQEAPAWIFGSIQSLENEGILYVPARGMPHP